VDWRLAWQLELPQQRPLVMTFVRVVVAGFRSDKLRQPHQPILRPECEPNCSGLVLLRGVGQDRNGSDPILTSDVQRGYALRHTCGA
jgi:hypothetical protein